jgi:hypothetical protein
MIKPPTMDGALVEHPQHDIDRDDGGHDQPELARHRGLEVLNGAPFFHSLQLKSSAPGQAEMSGRGSARRKAPMAARLRREFF